MVKASLVLAVARSKETSSLKSPTAPLKLAGFPAWGSGSTRIFSGSVATNLVSVRRRAKGSAKSRSKGSRLRRCRSCICTWQVIGSANVISGTYTVRVTVTDKDGSSGYADAAVTVTAPPAGLGDVNGDRRVDSTDALIVLSADVGFDTSQFCPMHCGDVNRDGLVNSTDALIILAYDARFPVPFPIGQPVCPYWIIAPPGCGF